MTLTRVGATSPSPRSRARRCLSSALCDGPILSSIGAAVALVVALEAVPGIHHEATAMGLTAALLLIGISVPSGVMLREREQRHRGQPFPRPLSRWFVSAATALGVACCLSLAGVVLACKAAWLVAAPLALSGAFLAAAFGSLLGALLGTRARHRNSLGRCSALVLVALLLPLPICGAHSAPATVSSLLALLPTVAIAEILCASLNGGSNAGRLVADAASILLATGLVALMVARRVVRDAKRGFAL